MIIIRRCEQKNESKVWYFFQTREKLYYFVSEKNRIDVFVWLRMYCVDKFEQSFKFNWVSIKIVKTSVLQQLILENVWNGFQP